jgi:hypothetical protein
VNQVLSYIFSAVNEQWFYFYNNYNLVASDGIDAGNNMFVGGAFYGANGAQSVAMIDVLNKQCIISNGGQSIVFTSSYSNSSCFYLKFEANKYGWLKKTPTTTVNLSNAVVIYANAVGRGTYNNVLRVDKVDRSRYVMYYPYNGAQLSLTTFETLINLKK